MLQWSQTVAETTGNTRYVISLDLLTSFSKDKVMDFLVEFVAGRLSEYIWNFGRELLVTNGMEQALMVLEPLLKPVIKKMLIYVIRMVALAVYNA